MHYPIKFEPIYKEMVWGGCQLSSLYNRALPYQRTGESWDMTCRTNEMGVVANGIYKGLSFNELIQIDPVGTLGIKVAEKVAENGSFPLLLKLISPTDNLSVQVHPDDYYAKRHENVAFGKTEIWVVLDAPQNAHLIVGLKDGVTRDMFKQAIEGGTSENCLEKVPVQKGDVIFIPSGLVHALTKDVVVAEVQQNSDITYRIYDYNRLGLDGNPRPLHVEKALDVIDFEGQFSKEPVKALSFEKEGNLLSYFNANSYFTLIKYDIEKILKERSDEDKFFVFTCIEGSCTVSNEHGSLQAYPGDSFFLPAGLGKYTIEGKCQLIKSFPGEVVGDFMMPLLGQGYSLEEVKQLVL